MSNTYVGNNTENFKQSPAVTVDRVIVDNGSGSSYYSPSGLTDAQWYAMTGKIVTVTIPFGTQSIADSIRTTLSSKAFKPYQATCAELDPAAEIGDYATVGGIYSLISKRTFNLDSLGTSDFSADTENTVTDKYPYITEAEREIERKTADIYSRISVTASEIRSEVSGWTGVSATAWSSTTAYAEGSICYLNGVYYKSLVSGNINHQPPNATYWEVYTEESRTSSAISVARQSILQTVSQTYIAQTSEYSSVASILQEVDERDASVKLEVYSNYAPTYSSSTAYSKNDVVKYEVSGTYHFYRYKYETSSTGIVPTNTTYWTDLGTSLTVQSLIETNLNGITLSVSSSGTSGSSISLTSGGITVTSDVVDLQVSSANITGTITADGVKSNWVYAGDIETSQIKAGTLDSDVIYAGTLDASQITTGTLSASHIATDIANVASTLSLGGSSSYAGIGKINFNNATYIQAEASGSMIIWGSGGFQVQKYGTILLNSVTGDNITISSSLDTSTQQQGYVRLVGSYIWMNDAIKLSTDSYGSSFPASPITGQLFFLI